MSLWMFVKTFGDICLYFSVVSAFPELFAYRISFLLPAVLGALAVGLATFLDGQGKGQLRWLCLLLTAAPFLAAEVLMDRLVLIPVAVYVTVLVARNRNHLEYYAFREAFKRSIPICAAAYFMLWVIWYVENTMHPEQTAFRVDMPFVYGLLYLFCGVMLQRQLRMGTAGKQSVLDSAQMAAVLGASGIAVAGILGLDWLLRHYAASFWMRLKQLLLSVFAAPFFVLAEALNSMEIPDIFDFAKKEIQEGEGTYTGPGAEAVPPPATEAVVEQPVAQEQFPWWLVIFILVVMTVVLVVLVGAYRKRQSVVQTQEVKGVAAPLERKRQRESRSNRAKLRQLYKSFLKQQRTKGLILQPHYTSWNVQEHLSEDTDPAAAAALREVYLSARYQESREVTAQQLKTARDALKEIRNEKEK